MELDASLNDARDLAQSILGPSSERWAHTVGVAERATDLASTVEPNEREVLVIAAWLHDIGYGEGTHDLGFHPLDGARFLNRLGWSHRVSSLVAHHSGARFVAAVRGLSALMSAYEFEDSPVMDALTYADQTIGPGGQALRIEERMKDMLRRHGPDSPNARAHHLRGPYLLAVAARVEHRLHGRCSATAVAPHSSC